MHILETPRLSLRPPLHRDDLLLHGLHSDPLVVSSVRDGVHPTIRQSKAALLRYINHWERNHFGFWMAFIKDEGKAREFTGYCGLMRSGANLPEDPNNVELVLCFHLAASGKGFAPEAGRAVVRFAFEHLKLEKVTAFIRPTNTRSLRAVSKIGLQYIRDHVYKTMTMRYFEITSTDAKKVSPDRLL